MVRKCKERSKQKRKWWWEKLAFGCVSRSFAEESSQNNFDLEILVRFLQEPEWRTETEPLAKIRINLFLWRRCCSRKWEANPKKMYKQKWRFITWRREGAGSAISYQSKANEMLVGSVGSSWKFLASTRSLLVTKLLWFCLSLSFNLKTPSKWS